MTELATITASTPPSNAFRATSIEARLILACCSVAPDAVKQERVRQLLASPIQWAYLVSAAGESSCVLQVYQVLSQVDDGRIPAEVLDQLRAFHQHNSIRNLMLIQELIRLLNLFDARGIDTLIYKGPSLAMQYYGDPAARMFWDLDILVHKKDVLPAKELLLSERYSPEPFPKHFTEQRILDEDCEYNFDSSDGRVHVEIHWNILPRHSSFNFDSNELWNSAISIQLAGKEVKTLAPEDLLLVLCIHAGDKHQWTALRMIQDVAQVLSATEETMDWDRFMDRVEKLDRMRTILLGLFLAHSLLDAPVPQRILQMATNDRMILNIAALVCGRLFREGHGLPGFLEWRHYRDYLKPAEMPSPSMIQSVCNYCRSILEPEFHDREELPKVANRYSFLHYLARVKRLIFSRRTDLIRRLR